MVSEDQVDAAIDGILDPGRYVERVCAHTGEVADTPLHPAELLVHRHRDTHPVDVHARYMMSRVVRSTGSERLALQRLRLKDGQQPW